MNKAINTLEELDEILEYGPYAWPGGYGIVFLMGDDEAVCFEAVQKNRELCAATFDLPERPDDEWRPVAAFIHWEGDPMTCAHTGKEIPSEYGDPWERRA